MINIERKFKFLQTTLELNCTEYSHCPEGPARVYSTPEVGTKV